MKKFDALSAYILVSLLAIMLALSGCALFQSPQAAFVTGVDAGLNGSGLLDEYDRYLDLDPKLANDPDTRRIRHGTAAKIRKLVKDAQASAK